ncbi:MULTISPECIES: ogr/Delta-like zinc finger family protein [unclassified Pseudomonas]|uniref:ogr/Delta-like zinc finger family protein n=1 Tax=unclassified Pseudomonas TaxID=196821 RepID=UPI00147407B8|nr:MULTISPECIES: ogr/Delta-like zinc finger family protein [unclassified Pseudomonas]NMY37970.1 ogr/Delta-like zinc finger family protein [Pseudomonas sp. WS 5078]NMY60653.1 ogr/Delta-like zinc finger family protein [Pseudomonas sp. WS 5354]
MRVYCKECRSKGRITSSDQLDPTFVKLYCQCNSATCGHTWVANLTFSHTLSPSAQVVDSLIFDRVRDMTRTEQQDLFEKLRCGA